MWKYYIWDWIVMIIAGILTATFVYIVFVRDRQNINFENDCRDRGGQPVVAFNGNTCINPSVIMETK